MRVSTYLKRPEFIILVIILLLFAIRPFTCYTETKTDRASYTIGSQMLASGHFYLESPPANFNVAHCVNRDGRFYSRYFPGTLMLGALGFKLFGSWYFLNVLALGGVLLILADLGRRLTGVKMLAWMPLILVGIYIDLPMEIFTFHSVIYSVFFTLLFVWCLYRGLEEGSLWRLAIAGSAIGCAAITRPMLPAILIIITGLIFLLNAVLKGRREWLKLAYFAAPVVICLCFQLWYNFRVTGSWLTIPFDQYDPHSSMGFGLKGDNFSGDYHLFTPLDMIRGFHRILWGRLGLIFPVFVSIGFLAWGLVALNHRRRQVSGNTMNARIVIVLVMAIGTGLYVIMMCAFWCGLGFRYYFLEVYCFGIILITIAAGWYVKSKGDFARKVVILTMLMFIAFSLFETAFSTYLGVKTTRLWKRIFVQLEDLSKEEDTLFFIHKFNENEYSGGRWVLGNRRTQYLLNPLDYKGKRLFAMSLGESDTEFIQQYADKRQIIHITLDHQKGEVSIWREGCNSP
ncbi:MAG: hypothetical protein HQ591_12655 [candidate division Zixibacteria bacterium]|nr:hypothetical protein [Candidatus Tariuqbacter arcticus]